ncbi:ADYC domain-containing protein [Pyxidicoccus sp. 3LFB2]
MKASTNERPGNRARGGARAVLLGLMALAGVTGCGGGPQHTPSVLQEARGLLEHCPTGTCSDTQNNGKGIYVAEGSGYCIRLPGPAPRYFCPERFQNHPNSPPELTGALFDVPGTHVSRPITTRVKYARWYEQAVNVVSIRADTQALVVTVRDGITERDVSGSDLTELILEFFKEDEPIFVLRFRPTQPENGVGLYQVEYAGTDAPGWQPYCADNVGTAAFLPHRQVSGETGRMTEQVDATAVTMACRTGAIATCMVWGYGPWQAQSKEQRQKADFLYGACIQAKRAAYFVQSGDFNSYTVAGTPVRLQDNVGIMNSTMPGVEALWSPEGAVCFSPEYRRLLNQDTASAVLPQGMQVPECGNVRHTAAQQGQLQALLQDSAPLATGPVLP